MGLDTYPTSQPAAANARAKWALPSGIGWLQGKWVAIRIFGDRALLTRHLHDAYQPVPGKCY
jgi:hypothetical protein